jgi:hypothetical protein
MATMLSNIDKMTKTQMILQLLISLLMNYLLIRIGSRKVMSQDLTIKETADHAGHSQLHQPLKR